MTTSELVIAGGGLTAARAIKSYREAGGEGGIALVGDEATLPYHRPALSKRYLRGETDATPHVENDDFYREHGVDVLLETKVAGVDPGARRLALDNGVQLSYGKLLVATGAAPRRLRVPGSDLDGVFALRSIADSTAIREASRAARRAVVVGGGFIGMEAAASLHHLGLDVTLIHLGSGLFDVLGSRELSEQLADLYRAHGVLSLCFGLCGHADYFITCPLYLFADVLNDLNCFDAGHLFSRARINALNLRVCVRALEQPAEKHSGSVLIERILGLARDFFRPVKTRYSLAN